MTKVHLTYEMKRDDAAGSVTEGSDALVTDDIWERLLAGERVGKVVVYLISLASLRGFTGGCYLLEAKLIETIAE